MAHKDDIIRGEKRETEGVWHLAPSDSTEGYVYRRFCDLCNSNLMGHSYPAALIKPGMKEASLPLYVCVCCILYIANGDLCDCD
ncbi:MAG: hypothetical protein ACRD5H_00215 [Nitrososphaerales archaeon]